MWASILEALMKFLLTAWEKYSVSVGRDVPSNPGLKRELDDKLAEWEKRTGADKCDLPRR
jgi:hypothetical protein